MGIQAHKIGMIPLIIAITSFLVRFWRFGHPAEVVFDEVHIGTFVTDYMNGSYFYDVHPPFGRLLVALSGYISGADSQIIDWTLIGNSITPEAVFMRIFPVVIGSLLPLIIYYLAKEIGFSTIAAVATSLIIAFESSLVVASRFMMHDIFFVTFGFLAIFFYLKHPEDNRFSHFLALSAVFIALSVSVKWLGLSFMAVILFLESRRLSPTVKKAGFIRAGTSALSAIGVYTLTIAVLYTSFFAIHLSLTPNSGRGDAYMSKEFQKTLIGSKYENADLEPLGFWGKFLELNERIFKSQKNLTAPHRHSSKWYEWPVMKRPISYWRSDDNASRIYLIGNPVVYWVGSLSIASLLLLTLWRIARKRFLWRDKNDLARMLILFGFAISFLPYAFIGRTLFLYHYFTPLIFSSLAIGFLLDRVAVNKKHLIATLLIIATAVMFFQYSKIIYGLPMKETEFKGIMPPSWR